MKKNERRDFLKQTAALAVGGLALSLFPKSLLGNSKQGEVPINTGLFSLFSLPYPYFALEFHIDSQTMEFYHTRHHNAYVKNLNKAFEGLPEQLSVEQICRGVSEFPLDVRNNAGGHYNHSLFWTLMKPNGGGIPGGKLGEAIISRFGSFEHFQSQFSDAAKSVFGSGWAWLVVSAEGKLEIGTTANQDNPLMDISPFKGRPVLALDVWEHAYYLHYQNKRLDYISAWWNVVNWEEAQRLYLS